MPIDLACPAGGSASADRAGRPAETRVPGVDLGLISEQCPAPARLPFPTGTRSFPLAGSPPFVLLNDGDCGIWRQRRRRRVTARKPASPRASDPHTQAPATASDEPPPELSARWAAAGAAEAAEAWVVADGLGVGVLTGTMLPMLCAGSLDAVAAAVGFGVAVGVRAGVDGRDDDAGAGPLGDFAGSAVTVTTPTACAFVVGFVAASVEAVRLTHAAPLDGVLMPALRLNNDGVRSVPSDPSWHEAVPSPLGQRPVNVTLPADAASVTDTSGAVPFKAWT
jgi:hypothetical protein